MSSDESCKVYVYKSDKGDGKWVSSPQRPPAGQSQTTWYAESNRTIGMVCWREDVWIQRLQSKLDAATAKAEDECQREVRDGIDKERREVLDPELERAGDRWTQASNEVNDARRDLARSIEELNNLQRAHDLFHRGLSLVLDIAAIANPEIAIYLAAVNVANHVTEAVPEVEEGHVLQPAADVGSHTNAEGVEVYAHHLQHLAEKEPDEVLRAEMEVPKAGMYALQGAIVLQDVVHLFKDIQTFAFSGADSLESVRAIREAFAESKMNWTQRWFGPKPKEVDAKFQKLEDAMKKEQKLHEEFDAALAAAHGDPYSSRFGTCVQKKPGMEPLRKELKEVQEHHDKLEYQDRSKGPY